RTADDWNRIHDGDDSLTLHEWMKNEIRRLYPIAPAEVKSQIAAHEQRSYGHYGLTHSVAANPIEIENL
ncbi:MAG: hypothetical protein U1E05_18810, partial [Patescibacteria group bacterium]|nr:hypothetical protein [Patescibacteria group bacterium]